MAVHNLNRINADKNKEEPPRKVSAFAMFIDEEIAKVSQRDEIVLKRLINEAVSLSRLGILHPACRVTNGPQDMRYPPEADH